MKLSSTLLRVMATAAIVTAVPFATVSCKKAEVKKGKKGDATRNEGSETSGTATCLACGMG